MSISAEPVAVTFSSDAFTVSLDDGRQLTVPLDWFPRLREASPEQRERFELSAGGVHWPDVDEDISMAGLLLGAADRTRKHAHAA